MSSTGGGHEEDNLLEGEARARGACVSNTHYELTLNVVRGASEYNGDLVVKFDYKASENKSYELFLDCITKTVSELHVNGTSVPVSGEIVKNNRVYIPAAHLKPSNEVKIKYTNAYDKNGNGFHHFVDPEDKQEYLYTNFEPFYAHRLLPCFDQPDIKGTLKLSISVPSEWSAVANNPLEKSEAPVDGRTLHHFKATPPLSTYLYALVVGPYEMFEEKHGKISMRMYVRKSLKKFLEPDLEELFTITKQGLDFYEKFYDCKYPFDKYDQIFCPEYNIGAMENPGCITYTEHYVYRDPPTTNQRLRRADTFLHEMAHMWFGDLVSPVWWDGLWLNESFASYMAALAIAEATKFGPASWLEFHSAYKRWAYREDQLSTTHPIQGDVADTNSTFQNFDGITYGKGASVLKQLVAVVSMDGFKAGMQHYFKTHPWKNTTIGDFLHSIEIGAKTDLKQWSKLWLETSGLNTLVPTWSSKDGKIDKFEITQTAEASQKTLRPHRLEIALYDHVDNRPTLRTSVFVDIKDASTVVKELVGKQSPAAVFINHNDHAYAKVGLDAVSLDYLRSNIEKLDDLTRQLVWSSLTNAVRDAQWPAQEIVHLIESKAPFETVPKLVQSIITAAQGVLSNFIPEEFRLEYYAIFYKLCKKQLLASKTQDDKIMWARALISAAKSKEHIQELLGMMQKSGVTDFELDQDMRWSIVQMAAAHSFENAEALGQQETEKDSSDRGKRAVETFKTSFPNKAVKEAAWERFCTDTTSSMKMVNAAMSGFNWHHQKDLLAPFVDKFFENIQSIFKKREFLYAENFYHLVFPHYIIDEGLKKKCQGLLASLDASKDTMLVRCLKESVDDIDRALACHALARTHKK